MWVWTARVALGLVAGVAAGLLYFGGLWWTVRRVVTSPRPHLLTLGSFFVRTAVVIGVVILIARMHWVPVATFMAAFVGTRMVMVHRLGPVHTVKEPTDSKVP